MRTRYPTALALITLVVLAAAPLATAQTYVGYHEFPGNPSLHGLDYHDGYLWGMHRTGSSPAILQIDPDDGQVVSQIMLNIDFTPTGVAWDGEHFRVSRNFTSSNNRIYRIGTDGNVVDDIPAPSALTNGLAWHDGYLWASRANPNDQTAHVRLDPATGEELEAIASPWTQPAGMAFLADGTFWATNAGDDGSNIQKLYRMDLATGEMIDEIDMPDGIGRPRGLAYDGTRYLYMNAQTWPGAASYRTYIIDLGTEGNPIVALSHQQLAFGTVLTDDVDNLGVTISNQGDGPLDIWNVAIEGDSEFSTAFDGASVEPGGNVQVSVSFGPQAYGPHDAALTFSTNDVANAMVSIPLSGFGIFPDATVGVAASEHNFGAVRIENPYDDEDPRAVRTWPLHVINMGAETLTVSEIDVTEPFTIEQGLDLPAAISPADTLTVLLGFRPPAATSYAGTATIHSDDASTPALVVELSGTGVDPDMDGGDALWTLTAPDNPVTSFQDRKVTVIRSMGDVTGDGTPDLAIGVRNYFVHGVRGNSWGEGEVLWSFNSCPNNFNCGAVSGSDGLFDTGLRAGMDLNGDGIGDVVFATGGGNDHVYALSGADGSVIWMHGDANDPYLASYNAVAVRYDFTGNGVPDVAAVTGSASQNSPNPYNARRVYLLDGASGEVVFVAQPSPFIPNFAVEQLMTTDGTPVVVAGGRSDGGTAHVTAYRADGSQAWTHEPITTPFVFAPIERGDGAEDIFYTGSGGFSVNEIARLDGTTGEVVWAVQGVQAVWSIDVIGDVTGNGTRDLAVGSADGQVHVYDGADGSWIWSNGPHVQVFGVSAVSDVTGDGIDDVAIATANGRLHLIDGASGDLLWTRVVGNGTLDQAAEVVRMIPDVDGNGAPEIAVGTRHGHIALVKSTGALVVDAEDGAAAAGFALAAPYPNPSAGGVTVEYALDATGPARLAVYDLLGRRVALLVDGHRPAGAHSVAWDGRGASGAPLAAGMYLVRLEAGARAETRRVMLLR